MTTINKMFNMDKIKRDCRTVSNCHTSKYTQIAFCTFYKLLSKPLLFNNSFIYYVYLYYY